MNGGDSLIGFKPVQRLIHEIQKDGRGDHVVLQNDRSAEPAHDLRYSVDDRFCQAAVDGGFLELNPGKAGDGSEVAPDLVDRLAVRLVFRSVGKEIQFGPIRTGIGFESLHGSAGVLRPFVGEQYDGC